MAANKPKSLKLVPIFSHLKAITAHGVTKEDWTDDMILKDTALPLSHRSDEELVGYIKEMLRGVTSAMTELRAYYILLLAWNIRCAKDPSQPSFPKKTRVPTKGLVDLLSTMEPETKGPFAEFNPPSDNRGLQEWIRGGTYMASSLLKLFSKDHTSWIKAADHLSDSYKKFTDCQYPMEAVVAWDASIEKLRRLYQIKPIFKDTLGQILYELKDQTDRSGMTEMLYEQHLSFTGMHIVRLFAKAVVGLRVEPRELLRALHTSSNELVLHQLVLVLTKYMGSTDITIRRETYKYARLYDPAFFSLLQTKYCADVVCLLGHIGRLCGNVGTGDVLGIASVANMSDEAKTLYGKVAKKIFDTLRSTGLPKTTKCIK